MKSRGGPSTKKRNSLDKERVAGALQGPATYWESAIKRHEKVLGSRRKGYRIGLNGKSK